MTVAKHQFRLASYASTCCYKNNSNIIQGKGEHTGSCEYAQRSWRIQPADLASSQPFAALPLDIINGHATSTASTTQKLRKITSRCFVVMPTIHHNTVAVKSGVSSIYCGRVVFESPQ